MIIPLIIIALLVVGVMVKRTRDRMVELKTKTIPGVVAKLVGDPTTKIAEIKNLKESNGVYSFELVLDTAGKQQTYTSYITKDGKLFFSGGTVVADLEKTSAGGTTEPQKKMTCEEVPTADAPKLTAFIVADCPFGLQMQRVMKMAIQEQSSIGANFELKYIGAIENGKITSMHGDKEAQENLRQICIREEQKDLYWPYVTCYMKEGKSDACLPTSGVDQAKVTACMADQKRGNVYAQKDFDSANKFSVSGSPTLLLNDSTIVSEFDFGGRTPDAMKQLLCCSSKNKLGFCSTEMSKESVAASYSVSDTTAADSEAPAANCN